MNESDKLIESLSFTLTKDEAMTCLKKARIIKTTGIRASVFCIIIGICSVLFFTAFLIQKDYNALVFSIVSLIFIAIIICVPNISLNKLAKQNSNGKVIYADIFEDKIVIGKGENSWEILLNKTSALAEENGLYIIFTKDKEIFTIPIREIKEENKTKDIIVNGTNPYK